MTKTVSSTAASMALEQRLKQGELQLKAEEAKLAKSAASSSPGNNAASDGLVRRVDAGGKGEGEKRLSGTRPEDVADPSKASKNKPVQKHGLALATKQANKQELRAEQHEALKTQSVQQSPLHLALDANGFSRNSGLTKSWSDKVGRSKNDK